MEKATGWAHVNSKCNECDMRDLVDASLMPRFCSLKVVSYEVQNSLRSSKIEG